MPAYAERASIITTGVGLSIFHVLFVPMKVNDKGFVFRRTRCRHVTIGKPMVIFAV